MQGVNLVLHSTTDYVPKKWNEGVWTKVLPSVVPIDKAFVAIGIEPDSNSGFSMTCPPKTRPFKTGVLS
jgi:hypothetical protein